MESGPAGVNPVAEIVAARREARQRQDPYVDVCILATTRADGTPDARAVSLRDIDDRGFGLLLNSLSPKWRQLSAGGCSLLLLWMTVRRQYRVYGRLAPMEPERLRQYWDQKARGSKLLEHYYEQYRPQSEPIASRAELLEGIDALAVRHPDTAALGLPGALQGVYLDPAEIDVWHGSPEDRLHDRRVFRRHAAGWTCTTVVP
jgi:pyridoxamine 5'-phosphate oxidase